MGPKDHRFDDVIDIKLPGAGGATRRAVALAVIVAAGVWLGTSVYSVKLDEVAVVQRFGKYVRLEQPGLHVKAPAGIESARRVAVLNVVKEEFGFHTVRAGVTTQYAERSPEELQQSLMLTGDLNLVDVEWILQYRIKDPVAYAFRVRQVKDTIRSGSEAVVRKVVGDRSFDEVVTQGDLLAPVAEKEMQGLFDGYGMGIEVQIVKMQSISPPAKVKDSFNKVNEAQQNSEKRVNEAREAYNQRIPAERGKALALVTQAEGYAIDRVNRAKGDAQRFTALLEEHRKAPAVTEQRLYLETMQEVLPAIDKKYIVEGAGRTVLPILPWGGGKIEEEQR